MPARSASRMARSYAVELGSAYPATQITEAHLSAWAIAFDEVGLDIADDVSTMLRSRSTFPPSVAQVYQAAREASRETMSAAFNYRDCVLRDDAECSNCGGAIHGHRLASSQILHGLHHYGRHRAGEADQLEPAKRPEQCGCSFEASAIAQRFDIATGLVPEILGVERAAGVPS